MTGWGQSAWGESLWGSNAPVVPFTVLGNNMAKTQFLSSEPLRLVFFPFFNTVTNAYVVAGVDVTTLVIKKPNGVLLNPVPTLVFDSDTDFWVIEIPVDDYMEGDWTVKATSDVADTLPQYRVFTWGDYVDELSTLIAIGTGRWKVNTATNRLEVYALDGSTILYEFNLTDSTGTPTSTSVYERVPV